VANRIEIPLFPLPNVVHFPKTELRLHIFELRYRRLIADLLARDAAERWIGIVVPSSATASEPPPLFALGTAGQLLEVQPLPDGRSNIVLRGHLRFEIEHEVKLPPSPYRRAVVRLLPEPPLEEEHPEVADLGAEIAALLQALRGECNGLLESTLESASGRGLESLVNSLAATLDLPVPRKLVLLQQPPLERARSMVSILRSRRKLFDLLRPYRQLAAGAAFN
jgi:Lon protease-like protein